MGKSYKLDVLLSNQEIIRIITNAFELEKDFSDLVISEDRLREFEKQHFLIDFIAMHKEQKIKIHMHLCFINQYGYRIWTTVLQDHMNICNNLEARIYEYIDALNGKEDEEYDNSVFVAYSRKLLRCLQVIDKSLDEEKYDNVKMLLGVLIEETKSDIEL